MKVLLLGSPQISVNAFEEVIKNFEVVAIVTQPDKPKGRGMVTQETPVAQLANKYKIKTFKPKKIMDIYEELKKLNFDVMLTFAFGQFIPTKILSLSKLPPLNIHGSLLPKYRGAAPIHWAILNGDQEIGITLMEMVKEMDAGQMFFKASQKILDTTTTGDGFKIIDKLATENIVKWLKDFTLNTKGEQQGDDYTLAPKILKEQALLKFEDSLDNAIRKIRGFNPFPGAFIIQNKRRIKIFDVSRDEIKNAIEIEFMDGKLYAIDYQKESKKRVFLLNKK